MNNDIYPGDSVTHKRTGERFRVEAIDDDEVIIRSDRRNVSLTPAQLANLYVLNENDLPDDAPAEPGDDDQPATTPDPIPIGSVEGEAAAGFISYFYDPEEKPRKGRPPGRKKLSDVPRYPNGRIRRERYDFLNSNDKLYKQGKAKTK